MPTPRLHANILVEELLRIFETDLKTSLSLKSVMRGAIEFLPTSGITDLVNGIWVNLEPSIDISKSELPKNLLITYNFRIVYVRRMALNENALKVKIADIQTITEKLIDSFKLADITNMTNGQVLWWLPTSVETDPPEDAYVSSIAADLTAIAFNAQPRLF